MGLSSDVSSQPRRRKPAIAVVFAAFVLCAQLTAVASVHAAPMTERQKIDALLDDVESRNDLKFIRLGSVHSGGEAAQMLRIKLRFAGSRVKTANEFIEYIASATASGHPYLVVYPDGRQVSSAIFLRAELKRLTQASAPPKTSR
ncbi:MAG: DUF5329 family protein [Betaproteobacteria bacterium]